MSRALFPAWRPDAAGRDALVPVASAIRAAFSTVPGVALRRPDQWHVTLCFVGHDVGEAATSRAMQALAGVGAAIPSHVVELASLHHNERTGSVVAYPKWSRELHALCDACAAALRRHGIVPGEVTRQPHITLAYVPNDVTTPDAFRSIDPAGIALAVTVLELLHNPGGRYDSLAQWPLTGAPLPPLPQQASLF